MKHFSTDQYRDMLKLRDSLNDLAAFCEEERQRLKGKSYSRAYERLAVQYMELAKTVSGLPLKTDEKDLIQ